MKKITAAKFLGTLILFASTSVFATTIVYSDSASFNAQLDHSFVDDYEDVNYKHLQSNAEMNNVKSEVKYRSTGFNDWNVVLDTGSGNHVYCAGCNGTFLLDFNSTSVSGLNGVFGAGFDFDGYYYTLPIGLFVIYGDGSSESFLLGINKSWESPFGTVHQDSGFWGITSSLGISSIHVGSFDSSGEQWTDRGIRIDNLTVGAKVPEPSSLFCFIFGVMCLVFVRKTKPLN